MNQLSPCLVEAPAAPTLVAPVTTWQPARLRGHDLSSRLVLPPMASGTGTDGGVVTEATLEHYRRIVRPHHGLAFVEYTYVQPAGRSEPNQLGLHTELHEAGLRRVAAIMRARGVLAGIQLTHGGGKTDAETAGVPPVGADALPIPIADGHLPPPRPLTSVEVEELIDAFEAAALSAQRAGFEAIEVHAAHGYLLNQWLSPLTNARADLRARGGVAREELMVRIMARLRSVLADETVLSVRFAAQDRLDGGIELADSTRLALALQQVGVDVLNVSSGLGGWRRGRAGRGEGYLVDDAAAIKAATGMPVIGVGGIETLAYADAALSSGAVDFVAVGRAALRNPDQPLA